MRYFSACSGIEAASIAWEPLGFEAAGFAEIEPFPSAVLAHHYPNVRNYGDFTKIEAGAVGPVDLLVGGPPCQSFSVTGQRGGMNDPRGNLALQFVDLVARLRACWVVFENVPGLLSSNGGRDILCLLDRFERAGYIIDMDILDAQFFGVPQRRRRVFIVCQHRDDLLQKKTTSSAQTIAQCLGEILGAILTVTGNPFYTGRTGSDASSKNAADGAVRRMRLFGLEQADCCRMLLENLDAERARFPRGLKLLDWIPGASEAATNPRKMGGLYGPTSTETASPGGLWNTGRSWRSILDAICEKVRSFTTSTPTEQTTDSEIFTFAEMSLSISAFIALSNASSPTYWNAVSSALTTLQEFMNYARQASRDLFGELERVSAWCDFLSEAEGLLNIIGDIRAEWLQSGEVCSFSESLRRHPAPSREAGEELAARLAASSGGCNDPNRAGAFVPMLAGTLKGGSGERGYPDLSDGNGGGLVPVVAASLRSSDGPHGHSYWIRGDANDNIHAIGQQVRRLTPVECERLQGFPDNHTRVSYRGKPAADGPRYKAIGNSMAVPVMRWIGERIAAVEALLTQADERRAA